MSKNLNTYFYLLIFIFRQTDSNVGSVFLTSAAFGYFLDSNLSLLHDWLDYQLPRPRRAHDRLVTVKVLGSPGPLTP